MDVRADVMRVHLLLDAAYEQLFVHMVIHTGEDDSDALFVRALYEHGQVVHSGRIDERHLTHSDDTNRVFLTRHMRHDIVEFVGYTEEIRAVDLIDLHAFGDGQVLEVRLDIGVFVRVYLIVQRTDM